MNLLSWNCRGLGNPRTVRVLIDLVKSHKPVFLFLSKTLVHSNKVGELCDKLGFDHYFAVDSVGRGGGLAVLWRRNFPVRVVDSSSNFIDVHVYEGCSVKWRLTCFYGFPERSRRRDSWDLIHHLAANSSVPWCIFGDFNDLLYASNKMGKHPHPQHLMDGFRSAVEDGAVVEMDLYGGKFTWEKSKGTPDWVRERLDRAFATREWWQNFPLSNLSVIHTTCSDHDPILLDLMSFAHSRKQFRFKFENTWLQSPIFHEEVSKFWKDLPILNILPKLVSVSSFMAKWGHNFFHKFRDKIRKQKEVVNSLVEKTDDESVKKYFAERDKLNDILMHEEIY